MVLLLLMQSSLFKEPDYDEKKNQLEEELDQEGETGKISQASTNQVF